MNRARPIRAALYVLLSVLLLAPAGAVLAQKNGKNAQTSAQDMINALRQQKQQLRTSHPFRGIIDKIPPGMTARRLPRSRANGDGGVTRQTKLLTYQVVPAGYKSDPADPYTPQNLGASALPFYAIPARSTDLHPHYSADEKYLFFASNRRAEDDTRVSLAGTYDIYRSAPDGSGLVRVTQGGSNKIEPNLSNDGTRLAYAVGGSDPLAATNGYQISVLNISSGTVTGLTASNPSGLSFADTRHPSWSPGGDRIAFAGRLAGQTAYHIFTVDTNSGNIVQLTGGTSNDTAPAWSPDGNLVAFTTNANDFQNVASPLIAATLRPNTEIYVLVPNPFTPNPRRVTGAIFGGKASNNRSPAWSTLRPDPLQVVPGEVNGNGDVISARPLLAFASDRADTNGDNIPDAISSNGSTNIYFINASIKPDPLLPGSFTVVTPEAAGNPGVPLQTTTDGFYNDPDANTRPEPSANFDRTNTTTEDYPTWPQYISSYRIAFQSNKTLNSNGDPALRNNWNLWSSTIFDINAPTLLKYDVANNQIVGVFRDSGVPAPGQDQNSYVRQFSAGETVRFRVRVADYESGVLDAYLQIKNPNSLPQSADGKEHKVYRSTGGVLDTGNVVNNVPREWEYQAINPNTYAFRPNGFVPVGVADVFGGIPASWPGWNLYLPGLDDELAFSGHLNPIDPDFWLKLWDDGPESAGGHEPNGEVKGDGIYTASWITPAALPSDWYLDVIVRDKAIDPFDPQVTTNWKIYDNIWGFTTKSWTKTGQILYVNDYDCGQKFFQTRFGSAVAFATGFNGIPTESWMTEIDPALLPQFYNAGLILNNVQNTMGQVSYRDGLTNDGTNIPVTQRYDQWRVLSRGEIPDAILSQYGARKEVQPADVFVGGSGPRTVTVAENCVIWHSPYTGDLFVGPGTILDNAIQTKLRNFISQGGRLFLNGQDVAWGLSLGVPGGSPFLSQIFKVEFVSDDATTNPDSNQINLVDVLALRPIARESWNFPGHNFPGTRIPNDPPSAGPIYIQSTTSVPRTYGALNQATPDVIKFLPADAPPAASIEGTHNVTNTPCIVRVTDATNDSRVIFSSIGWEAITPEFFGTIILKNRRSEMLHNVGDYLRTGRIIGTVKDINGAGPLRGVFIRAVSTFTGLTGATTLSDSEGNYTLSGLDPNGIYSIDAFNRGFLAQHADGNYFHGGYQSRVDLFLTPAQNGSISGTVIVKGSNPAVPVAGAIVEAVDPTDNSKIYRATTDAQGKYQIKNVPVLTDPANPTNPNLGYVVRIINLSTPNNPNTPLLPYGGSEPRTYGRLDNVAPTPPLEKPRVKVGASEDVTGIDFALTPLPGRLTGKVVVAGADGNPLSPEQPIAGATVTATVNGTAVTAVTNALGVYDFGLTIDPGTYIFTATAPGYKPSAGVSLTISSSSTVTKNFALKTAEPGSISGIVTVRAGDSSTAIQGALIEVAKADGTIIKTTTTTVVQTVDSYTFNYRITNVPAGASVKVRASKSGYTPNPTPYQDVAITEGAETKDVNFTLAPLNAFARGLSLVSAPYAYTNDIVSVLNLTQPLPSSFLFAARIAGQPGSYVFYPTPPADTFHPGRGYFLNLPNAGAAITTGPGTPGVSYVQTDANGNYAIDLVAGWNLIGAPQTSVSATPYPYNFLLLRIREANGSSVDVPTAQSGSNPAIGGALWTYESGTYQLAFVLDPWRGYWIYAFRNCQLLINATGRQDRSSVARATAGEGGWQVSLLAKAGTQFSAPASLGVTRAAADGYDRFKVHTPPAMENQNVTLTFEHDDWGAKSGRFSQDLRSLTTSSHVWNFTVTSNIPNAPIVLTWPSLASVPKRHELVLTDLDSQTKVSLRTRNAYTIAASPKTITRRFRLEVRRADRRKLEIMDVAAHVNGGGTTRAANSASISYRLTSDADVQITVLQGGRRIRTVEPARSRAAGQVELTWDLKNDGGQAVPSNAYTVEIRATDASGNVVRRATPLLITR